MASSSSKGNDTVKSETDNEKIDNVATEIDTPIVAPHEAYKNVLQFAKDNHLKYKRNSTYCKVCNVKISSSLKRLKEHVAEQTHKDKAVGFANVAIPKVGDVKNPLSLRRFKEHVAEQMHKDKAGGFTNVVISKVELSEFVTSETSIKSLFSHEVLINDRFCLSFASYETIRELGNMMRCQTCEVSVSPNEAGRHVRSWQHERGKQTASVLTSFDTEFLREVRPGVYHCGFCNFIEGSMNGLENHLKSITHKNSKARARRSLNEHMPDVMEMRHMEIFLCMRRGMMNLFL